MSYHTSMPNARVSLRTLSCIIFSFISFHLSAHFGTKGPFGGTVSCIISQDSLVYIGTANGGVFESTTNQLIAWRARPVGLTSGKITALAHSGSDLYAATADSGIFIFNGFVGADRYWNKINNGLTNLKIRSLLAIDSVTVIAGTDGNGVFKTTDKGATWVPVNNASLNNAVITGMVKAGNRIILISWNEGVFISDNNGNTWTDFNDAHTLNISGTATLSYNAATDELLMANNNGLYITAAASTGNSPVYVAAQLNFPSNASIRGISNNGTDWYLATNQGIYTTPANAIDWTAANTGLAAVDVTAIAAVQNRLLAGVQKEGVFKAMAGTPLWTPLNTGFNNPVTATMAAGGDSLVIAVTEKGVFISKDLATSYVSANNGLSDSLNVNDIIIAGTGLLAATKNGGVFFTADTGKTWTAINTGLSGLAVKKLFYANQQKYAIDVAGNVFASTLNASSWNAIQSGLPSGVVPTAMAFYGGKLVLGTLGNGVYVKEQSADSWTAANTGLSNLDVTAVTASGNKVFAGTRGSGVFISDIADLATISWSATAATSISHTTMIGLNGNNIQAMANYAGYVYASYKGGLLTTADNGTTWIAGGNQFNLPSFTDVTKICFVSSRIFVPTENNAVYSNALSELPALPDTLLLSRTSVVETNVATTLAVSVTSNRGWTVSVDQPWLTVSQSSGFRDGDFNIVIASNTGPLRTGTVTVTAGAKVRTIPVTQDGLTGTGELDNLQASLKLYPNPAHGTFTIDFAALNATVENVSIYDISGKMLTKTAIEKGQLPLPVVFDHPAGIYIVQLNTDKGTVAQRLSIQ